MYDSPSPEQLLAEVARFLRDEAGPALARAVDRTPVPEGGALAYQARVAANMLDMVRRQAALAPAAETAELTRLQALLGEAGDLGRLNHRLAERIADGSLPADAPGLADHLWRITLDKLAVDQPGYATCRRHGPGSPGDAG